MRGPLHLTFEALPVVAQPVAGALHGRQLRAHSFTRAAAKLGVSQSALSHTLRALEAQLGVRLLNRSTRSVAPTAAGERLLQTLAPRFAEIDAELAALGASRDTPAGSIRISSPDYPAAAILLPKLARFLPRYPDIKVELDVGDRLVDIVAEHYDAGVRDGELIAKDMVAVPIGPALRMAVVGTPAYFERHPAPKKPQDLTAHACINLRLPTHGDLYAWEFQKGRRKVNVRVEGQFICNRPDRMIDAALAGLGLAYLLEDVVQPHLAVGHLQRVLEDWCPRYPGYHLYYPSRRQPSAAFKLLVDALRYRN